MNEPWNDGDAGNPFGDETEPTGNVSPDPFGDYQPEESPAGSSTVDPFDPFSLPHAPSPAESSSRSREAVRPASRQRSLRVSRIRIPLIGLSLAILAMALFATLRPGPDEANWEDLTRSVVLLQAPECGWSGSGTVVLNGGHILTNAHVAFTEAGQPCDLDVFATDAPDLDPVWIAFARPVVAASDLRHDLSVLQTVDRYGRPVLLEDHPPVPLSTHELSIGDRIKVLGFPGMGGIKITITPGEQAGWWTGQGSGWEGDFYKTSAKMGPGVSGGAAFAEEDGSFIGIPTGGSGGSGPEQDGDLLGLIRPSRYAAPLLDRARAEAEG